MRAFARGRKHVHMVAYDFPDAGHELNTKMSAWREITLVILEKVLRLLSGHQRMAIALVCKTWQVRLLLKLVTWKVEISLSSSSLLQGQQSSR